MYLRDIAMPRPLTPNLQRGDLTDLRGKLRQIQICFGFNSFHHSITFRKPTSWFKLVKQIFCYLGSYSYHINILLFFFSCPVISDSLGPRGLQHAKPPCPSASPEVCQVHVHCICHAIQPSNPLMPSPPSTLNLSQQQGFFH